MASVGTYYVTIMPEVSGFSTKIKNELESAAAGAESGRKSGTSFMSGFGGAVQVALGNVMGNVAMQLGNVMMSGISGGIERMDTMSVFPRIMANMGIDEAQAKAAADRVAASIQGLPTALDDAVRSVQRLTMSTGDVDKATDVFIAFNDALISGGAPMALQASALEQFSQAVNKGKPDMLEWRSLMNAMPAQLNQVASAMGMTASELGEGLRQGTIPMDDFLQTIVRLDHEGVDGFASFSEQVSTMTDTVGVAMANVNNRVEKFWQGIFEGVGQERISGALNAITEQLPAVGDRIGDILGDVVGFFETVAADFDNLGLDEQIGDIISNLDELARKFAPGNSMWTDPTAWAHAVFVVFNNFILVPLNDILVLIDSVISGLQTLHLWMTGHADSLPTTDISNIGAGGTAKTYSPNGMQVEAPSTLGFKTFFDEVSAQSTETSENMAQQWRGLSDNLQLEWETTGTVVGNHIGGIRISSKSVTDAMKSDFGSTSVAAKLAGDGIVSNISTSMSNALAAVNGKVTSINASIGGIKGKQVGVGINVYKTGINGVDFKTSIKNGTLSKISVGTFATGGIVTGPTWSLMGESGSEAIVPLDNPRYVGTFASAIARELGGRSAGTVNNYYIDGNLVNADARLAAALDVVAQRVGGRRRMGAV